MAGKSAKSIEAGNAFVRLFTKDSQLRSGLKNAAGMLKNFGAKAAVVGGLVTGVGTSVAAPLLAAAFAYEAAGSELADASARMGIPVSDLSALGFAAEMSAASLGDLESGMSKMDKTLVAAAKGSKGAKQALADVGLTVEHLQGLSKSDQFKLIADRISKIENPSRRAAAAMAIFGKGGAKLLPLLNEGAAGIAKLEAEARDLGMTMTDEDAAAAEEFGDTVAKLNGVLKRAAVAVGSAVVPILQDVAELAIGAAKGFSKWISEHRELFAWALKIAAAVMAAGAVITAVGLAGMGLAAVLSGLGTVIGVLAGAFSAVFTVLGAILSPVGLFVSALAAVVYFSGAGGAALDWLMERFGSLAADATSAFGAIGKAIASGNLGLAAQVAWAFIKVQFRKGVDGCVELFYWLVDTASEVWAGMQDTLARGAVDAFAAVDSSVVESTDFFADAWTETINWIAKQFEGIAAAAEKAWIWVQSLFDDSIDVDVEFKRIDDQLKGFDAAADENASGEISERERARKQQLAEIEQNRKDTQDELKRMQEAERKKRQAARDGRLGGDSDELTRAQAEFQAAIDEAGKLSPSGKPGAGDSLADRLKGLPDFTGAVATGESKMSSSGTFSAAAARGLGNTLDSRIAAATEASAGYLRQIANDDSDDEEPVG